MQVDIDQEYSRQLNTMGTTSHDYDRLVAEKMKGQQQSLPTREELEEIIRSDHKFVDRLLATWHLKEGYVGLPVDALEGVDKAFIEEYNRAATEFHIKFYTKHFNRMHPNDLARILLANHLELPPGLLTTLRK